MRVLALTLAILLPGVCLAQEGESDFSDRLSLLLYYGWPKKLTTAFAENQICPSGQAREVGVGVSYPLTSALGIQLGGGRFFAQNHDVCVNGHIWIPEEGPYTYEYTTPAESTMGYPFSTIWARLSLQRELARGLVGRAFGGFGFMGGKKTPFGTFGIAGETGTGRIRLFLEYEAVWYRVRLEDVELQFMDMLLVQEKRSTRMDPHTSTGLSLGLRIDLHSGGAG